MPLVIYDLRAGQTHITLNCMKVISGTCLLLAYAWFVTKLLSYLLVIPWAQVVCLISTPEAQGSQARGLRVYILGEP